MRSFVHDSPATAPAVALTVAGSDSGGGAGIQADLKTFHAFGVFGTSAITAVTAQNTLGVQSVHAVPPAAVLEQIRSVAADLRPTAGKSGMLATREIIEAVARGLREHGLSSYVLDPVMVASSGDRLLDAGAEAALARELIPLCTLVTPNLAEAAVLAGREITDESDMSAAAESLVRIGARAALIKGGHLDGDTVTDLLFDGDRFTTWRRPKLKTRNTHGTGCTLSAAITAGLACGRPLTDAVDDAITFVRRAIERAPAVGSGNGPLNHFVGPLLSAP